MKSLLFFMLLSSAAFAQETNTNKEQNFSELKQMVSANVDERIAALQAFKSCVNGATSKEQLKACRESHKDTRKGNRDENRAERQAFKEKRKQMREEKRKTKASN